jgi:hypothetical protein
MAHVFPWSGVIGRNVVEMGKEALLQLAGRPAKWRKPRYLGLSVDKAQRAIVKACIANGKGYALVNGMYYSLRLRNGEFKTTYYCEAMPIIEHPKYASKWRNRVTVEKPYKFGIYYANDFIRWGKR